MGLDPLYLSARGANGADLYAMGEMLEQAQHICQGESAALVVVTHFNRKAGEGAGRITGAGPAEWGRVLLSSIVRSRSTNPLTKETTVLTEIQIVGGEVPDQVLRVLRRVRAENPDDLDSPLHVVTSVTTADTDLEAGPQTSDVGIRLRPAAQKLLEALELGSAAQMALVDRIKTKHGHGLREETVSRELGELSKLGRVKATDPGKFQPKVWSLV